MSSTGETLNVVTDAILISATYERSMSTTNTPTTSHPMSSSVTTTPMSALTTANDNYSMTTKGLGPFSFTSGFTATNSEDTIPPNVASQSGGDKTSAGPAGLSATPIPTYSGTSPNRYNSDVAIGTTILTLISILTANVTRQCTNEYSSEGMATMNLMAVSDNDTGSQMTVPPTDKNLQDDVTTTLSIGAIAGIVAGGLLLIIFLSILCVRVYALKSQINCNSVTPNEGV